MLVAWRDSKYYKLKDFIYGIIPITFTVVSIYYDHIVCTQIYKKIMSSSLLSYNFRNIIAEGLVHSKQHNVLLYDTVCVTNINEHHITQQTVRSA